jgi:hypothetical protein
VIYLGILISPLMSDPYELVGQMSTIIQKQPEKFAVDVDLVGLKSVAAQPLLSSRLAGKVPLKLSTPQNTATNLPVLFFCSGTTPEEHAFLRNDSRMQSVLDEFKSDGTFNPSIVLLTT